MFLKNNQEQFIKTRNFTIEEFIKLELGFSKASFYQHIKAYQLCLDYGKPELYEEVNNYKVLLEVAKIPDEKERKKAFKKVEKQPETSEYDIEEIRRVHQVNSVEKKDRSELIEDSEIFREKSTSKRAVENYFISPEKKTAKIEIGVLEKLTQLYESISERYITENDEHSRGICDTYDKVIKDLREIVEFGKIK